MGDETREVPRRHATGSLTKATEFAETAQTALGGRKRNAAGLAAIHAGISAADAALIATDGVRSISKDHGAVVRLLESRAPRFTAAQRRQLLGLLKMKNQVAYDARLLTEVEARQLVEHATRLVKWATALVVDSPETP